MPDDLEAQLQAFGATLESRTGEPIANGSPATSSRASPRHQMRPPSSVSKAVVGSGAGWESSDAALCTIRSKRWASTVSRSMSTV